MARRWHPDQVGDADDAEQARSERYMRAANEAWAVLGDTDARRTYDRDLVRAARPTSPPPPAPPPPTAPYGWGDDDGDQLGFGFDGLGEEGVSDRAVARTPFALAMRFLPWVALAVGGALLAIAVLSTDSGEPIFEGDEFERAQVTPGDCLNVGDDTYSVVSCDVANSGVFVRQIGPNGLCPTEAPLSYRLSRLTLCLRPNQFTELPGE